MDQKKMRELGFWSISPMSSMDVEVAMAHKSKIIRYIVLILQITNKLIN